MPRHFYLRSLVFFLVVLLLTASCSKSESSLTTKAIQRDATAQNELGLRYYTGQGIEQNYEEAAKWYKKAARQGFVEAQADLGFLYQMGHGVNQDYAEAKKWHRKAAAQGNVKVQFALLSTHPC